MHTEGVDMQEGGISATLIVDVTTTAKKKSLYQSIIKSGLSRWHPNCHMVGLTETFSPVTSIKHITCQMQLDKS